MAARKKKKAKKKAARRSSKREILCVGSKVKAYIKSHGMKSSGDLVEAISNQVHSMIDGAVTRTTSNKRSTVRPHDL